MNHDCQGDFFTAAGKRWYRCLLDSTIIELHGTLWVCPNCNRAVNAAKDHGQVETRAVAMVDLEVHPGQFSEFVLPDDVANFCSREPAPEPKKSRTPPIPHYHYQGSEPALQGRPCYRKDCPDWLPAAMEPEKGGA